MFLAWENEAWYATNELGRGEVEIVYPPVSIKAEPPVALVEKIAARRGTTAIARAYLDFLYTNVAQEIAGRNYYRPTGALTQPKFAAQFPNIETFAIDEVFGGWAKAQKAHFEDGAIFDQIFKR